MLMGFRIHHPKIWHFGTKENSQSKENRESRKVTLIFLTFSPLKSDNLGRIFWPFLEAGHNTVMWQVLLLHSQER
jgi:hypothetical protein